MAFATAHSIALRGAQGHLIDVQVDLSSGMVGTSVVGRPDATLNEARDRVKMAINNTEPHSWPSTKRVTILLAPADLPKSGTHFDLAMAVAVKAADRKVPVGALEDTVFIGELTLSGQLRAVPGVLPMVMAAAARGIRRVFVPETQAHEASHVPGMTVFGMRSLAQVVAELRGDDVPDADPVAPMSASPLLSWRGHRAREDVDMADVVGLDDVKFALEVAAAGTHHVLLIGPKGSGKTTMAERVPSLLPDLTQEQSLELSAIHSLAGVLEDGLITRPPFFAPHHDASVASLLGGGTGRVRPGELTRAHHGVLFLDELPLFRADVVDALRQPMESGEITVARGEESATYPARGLVVLAANPCPCGNYALQPGLDTCRCKETVRNHYRRKLTGPVLDRIDITREFTSPGPQLLHDRFAPVTDSATIRSRVAQARRVQAQRYTGRGWAVNGHVPGPELLRSWPLTDEGQRRLEEELYAGRLTRRGVVRVHRVAWTVADLAGVERPGVAEVEVALLLRKGDPLPDRVLRRAA
ncbi:magnesium chelatase [Nocardioides gansuensis]|uniref:Magnesium chelatase n=1 Tax=Nocardioides gansuensis TaxID=2138300 RepID=A0A2T8FAB5_9ACTN|nr:YifB family Mg chelatase-like AAA ATPase [Nocardioides gansuensis]PVG82662.1 magnesium chelatase [Nocardioides gansuensis]